MESARTLTPPERALMLRVGLILATLMTAAVALMHYARAHLSFIGMLGMQISPQPLWALLALEVPVWFGWVLLLSPLLRVADRFPVVGPRRWANLGIHLSVSLLAILANAVLTTLGRWPILGVEPGGFPSHVATYFVISVPAYLTIYALIVLGHHALCHARNLRQRELDETRLEGLLMRARLQALQSQVQPHFMSNTLNGIAGLIGSENERALLLLGKLGALLRDLAESDEDEVALADELEALGRYVALQEARYGDRFRFSPRVPEETLGLVVPRFVLQPLVENAVKHGVERRLAPVAVRVDARLEEGSLVLRVVDDGPGLAAGFREGVGLGNLRARLQMLYGSSQALRLASPSGGGTEVTVVLPVSAASPRPGVAATAG